MNEDLENLKCKKCSTLMTVIDRGCEYEEYMWWCKKCGTLAKQGLITINYFEPENEY